MYWPAFGNETTMLSNEKLSWNEALCRNEYMNKLTDWYKFSVLPACRILKIVEFYFKMLE